MAEREIKINLNLDQSSGDLVNQLKLLLALLSDKGQKLSVIDEQELKNASEEYKKLQDILKKIKETEDAIKEKNRRENEGVKIQDNLFEAVKRSRKAYKDAAAATGEHSREAIKLKIEYEKLNAKAREFNKIGRDAGNSWGNALDSFQAKFNIIGNIVGNIQNRISSGIIRALKSTVNIAADFESQMSAVKAITGASAAEFERLEADAIRLGGATIFTAKEVAQLQTEYAKLGFSTEEILNATEATLALAAATDSDLADSAAVAGNVLRAFQLDASETVRVVDVMAASFTSSALNLSNFTEAMKFVAPIAKAANIDLETTTALLAKLADNGLKGSIAGTALKRMLSQLSDSASDLTAEIGFTVKSTEDLSRAFKILATRNIDLSKATQLADERSKAALLTFAHQYDKVEALADQYKKASGNAKEMADIRMDTLSGSIAILQSNVEGFILEIDKGSGVFSTLLRNGVDAMSSIVTGLRSFTESWKTSFSKAEEYTDNLNKEVMNLIETFRELDVVVNKTPEQLTNYEKAVLGIADALPEAIVGVDAYGKIILKSADEIEKLALKQNEFYNELKAGDIKTGIKEVSELVAKHIKLNKQLNDGIQVSTGWNSLTKSRGELTAETADEIQKLNDVIKSHVNFLHKQGMSLEDIHERVSKELKFDAIESKYAEGFARVYSVNSPLAKVAKEKLHELIQSSITGVKDPITALVQKKDKFEGWEGYTEEVAGKVEETIKSIKQKEFELKLMPEGMQKDLAKVDLFYDKLKEKDVDFTIDTELLERRRGEAKQKIRDEYNKKLTEKEEKELAQLNKMKIEAMDNGFQKEVAKLDESLRLRLIKYKDNDVLTEESIKLHHAEMLKLITKFQSKWTKEEEANQKERARNAKQALDKEKKEAKDSLDVRLINAKMSTTSEKERLEQQAAIYAQELAMMKQSGKYTEAEIKKMEEKVFDTSEKLKDLESGFNVWRDVFGFDPSDKEQANMIAAIEQSLNQVTQLIQNAYSSRVDAANKAVEARNREVDEAQSALETEIALGEAGFEANVELKKKELAQAKADQEKALAQQKKAIQQQRKVDAALQATNLITATAQIWRNANETTKNPVLAQIIAGIATAAMWGSFFAAQKNASKVSGYATGVIDLAGPGTSTSDSIPTRLSKGESVMRADTTREYYNALSAMHEGKSRMQVLEALMADLSIGGYSVYNDNKTSVNAMQDAWTKKIYEKMSDNGGAKYEIQSDGSIIMTRGNSTRIIRN